MLTLHQRQDCLLYVGTGSGMTLPIAQVLNDCATNLALNWLVAACWSDNTRYHIPTITVNEDTPNDQKKILESKSFLSRTNSFESGKCLWPHNTAIWKCKTYNNHCWTVVPDTREPFYMSRQSYSRQAVSKIHQMHSRWRITFNTHRWSSSEWHCHLSI